jgi:hypothetical protein
MLAKRLPKVFIFLVLTQIKMNKLKTTLLGGLAALILSASPAKGQTYVYDDFESGNLDTDKWTVMQDTEGQPLMEEYGILDDGASNVYHMQTSNGGRTALVPKHEFIAGETLEYEVNHVSGIANRGNLLIIQGIDNPHYSRHGVIDPNSGPTVPFDFGRYNITLKVNSGSVDLIRKNEEGDIMAHNLPLSTQGGRYKFYIESWADDDAHFDYDNFVLTTEQPVPTEELSWGSLKARFK